MLEYLRCVSCLISFGLRPEYFRVAILTELEAREMVLLSEPVGEDKAILILGILIALSECLRTAEATVRKLLLSGLDEEFNELRSS